MTIKAHRGLTVDEVFGCRLWSSGHDHLSMKDLLKIWTMQIRGDEINVGCSLTLR
jgi:hypothetical protein